MENDFINLTSENIESEHLSCIIRTRTKHLGVETKRKWLSERLTEGHVFRKLNVKAPVFIEYAPLEKAWVPVEGKNFVYIYCLWIDGKEFRGKGYGKQLIQYCIDDAKAQGKSGVCLLGSKKQKHWLTSQDFAKKYGFVTVDSTESGYELLALSFDGTNPHFTQTAKSEKIENQNLTVYYDDQCPFIAQNVELLENYCKEKEIPLSLMYVDSHEKAKNLPCVFNNWAVFYKGKFQTVNLLLDLNDLVKIMKKEDSVGSNS